MGGWKGCWVAMRAGRMRTDGWMDVCIYVCIPSYKYVLYVVNIHI